MNSLSTLRLGSKYIQIWFNYFLSGGFKHVTPLRRNNNGNILSVPKQKLQNYGLCKPLANGIIYRVDEMNLKNDHFSKKKKLWGHIYDSALR